MLQIVERQDNFVHISAHGKLSHADYDRILPQVEGMLVDHPRLRVIITLDEFDGWEPSAFIEDLKFDFKYRDRFDKIAVVGEGGFEKLATVLSKPIFSGEIRFFEGDIEQARHWIDDGDNLEEAVEKVESQSSGGS